MRWSRAHNRLALCFIFSCCLISLYALALKINRILIVNEMERIAHSETTISNALYSNNTQAETRSGLVRFVIQAQDGVFPLNFYCESQAPYGGVVKSVLRVRPLSRRVFVGWCETAEDPFMFRLVYGDFVVDVETETAVPERETPESVVCMTYLMLHEDVHNIEALLDFYTKQADLVVLYADSMSDSVYQKVLQYNDRVQIMPWKMLEAKRTGLENDRMLLSADSYSDSVTSSAGDCVLRWSTTVSSLSVVDIRSLPFTTDINIRSIVLPILQPDWPLTTINAYRVTESNQEVINVSGVCYSKNEQEGCINLTSSQEDANKFTIKKNVIEELEEKTYSVDVAKCLLGSNNPETEQPIMKFEFEVGRKRGRTSDPCEVVLRRDAVVCRGTMQYSKRMFHDHLKISIVQKRALLRFYNGCYQ